MKKLIILLVLGILVNTNPIQAQAIINPTGDETNIINLDLNAANIVLTNISTGEVVFFTSAREFFSQRANLSEGIYKLEYTLNEERHKMKFIIKNNN